MSIQNEEGNQQVLRWDVPFADVLFPSVSVIIPPGSADKVTLVVLPHGFGQYPGYLVEFKDAPLLLCSEETGASSDPDFIRLKPEALRCCTFLWVNSPLLRRNRGLGSSMIAAREPLKHFLVFGGDAIVEILGYQEPVMTPFSGPISLSVNYDY